MPNLFSDIYYVYIFVQPFLQEVPCSTQNFPFIPHFNCAKQFRLKVSD